MTPLFYKLKVKTSIYNLFRLELRILKLEILTKILINPYLTRDLQKITSKICLLLRKNKGITLLALREMSQDKNFAKNKYFN